MRRPDTPQQTMFSYRTLEERIRANHPLRKLRVLVDSILATMHGTFEQLYFVQATCEAKVTPHVAMKKSGSAIDGRTTRHAGYAVSLKKRKLVEEIIAAAAGPAAATPTQDGPDWQGADPVWHHRLSSPTISCRRSPHAKDTLKNS